MIPTPQSKHLLEFSDFLSAFLILISGTLMYLFGLRTALAKTVGIGSSRIPAAVLFLSLCSASLKDLRVPARFSLWDPFYINRQKNKVLKTLVKFFQSRNVDWKKFGVWMSESFFAQIPENPGPGQAIPQIW